MQLFLEDQVVRPTFSEVIILENNTITNPRIVGGSSTGQGYSFNPTGDGSCEIGDYDNNNGLLWDNPTRKFYIKGDIVISGDITSSNYTVVAPYQGYFLDYSTGDLVANNITARGALIAGAGSDIDGAYIHDLSVGDLISGTIASQQIILSLSGTVNDCYIASGKTDFTTTQSGFILGIDNSDSDRAKFYIGDSTHDFHWNGVSLTAGGWTIGTTTITSTGIILDSTNQLIQVGSSAPITIDGVNKHIHSDNYTSGVFGSGFYLDSNLLEVGNIACRGLIRTAVFQKNVVNVMGGNFAVLDGDVLDADMTASDTSTLTVKGNTTFAVGDILRIKDGTDDEWMEVDYSYSGSATEVGSISETNANVNNYLNATLFNYGQSFSNTNQGKLANCQFYLKKYASPTGNITATLYAHTGTYGTSSKPTGTALATSDPYNIADLTTSYQWITFNFTGSEQIVLSPSTYYVIVINYSGGDTINFLGVAGFNYEFTNPGNESYLEGTWKSSRTYDICFKVYSYALGAASNPYNVIRDKDAQYSAGANPVWKKGATVVNYKQTGNGGVYMTASDTNAPYIDVFTHAGSPWDTITTKARLGWLKGITDANVGLSGTDVYGLYSDSAYLTGTLNAISGKFGTSTDYWSVGATGLTAVSASTDVMINYGKTQWDNTQIGFILGYDFSDTKSKFYIGNTTDYFNFNGANVSFRTTLADAIVVDYGSNIKLQEGGSIKFTSVTAPTACTATLLTTTIDSYSEANYSYTLPLGFRTEGHGQSFTGNGTTLDYVTFYLRKYGNPTGNAVAKIYTHSGVYGTSSVPGTLLATSDNFDVSTLTTSETLINFTFSGAEKIVLGNGVYYILTIEYYDGLNYFDIIGLAEDTSEPSADGNVCSLSSTNWSPYSGDDLCFYVYKDAGLIDNGTHSYKVTYITATGETELGAVSNTVTVDATHKQVDLTAIPISSSGAVTQRKIYRTKAGGNTYYLLTTINNNSETTYTDNTADSNLTSVPNFFENSSFGKIFIDGIKSLSLGNSNTYVGQYSGKENTFGYLNSAIGGYSLRYNTIGFGNTANGYGSLHKNTIGYENTAIGHEALWNNTEAYGNTAVGSYCLKNNITGLSNVALGSSAGYNSTGDLNLFLGYQAGYYETGSNKLFIDNASRTNEATARTSALIYGVFNATPASQTLTLNAAVNALVSYSVAGTKVVGTQVSAIGLNAKSDTDKITDIITALRAHGLIGPDA
jgi:hypothetical protein